MLGNGVIHGIGNREVVPRNRYLAQIAVVLVAQFAAGKLGDLLQPISSGGMGPVWPASGIALGALLLCGDSVWPGIAGGAFLLAFLSSLPHWAALACAAGTTLTALVGAFLLRHLGKFDRSLSRLQDVLGLIVFGALGSSLVGASIGASLLYAAPGRGWSELGSAWLIYWLGGSTGVLLATPLVLTFSTLLGIRDRNRLIELAALLLLLTLTGFIVFADLPLVPGRLVAFAVFPFVIWAALRFGMGTTALSIVLIATIATLKTGLGSGPFASDTPFSSAVLLEVFLAVLAASGLTLAAGIAQREHAEGPGEQLARQPAALEVRLRLATIVESSDDAVIGTDRQGRVRDWNKAAERIFGYSAAEAIGKNISFLAARDHLEEGQDILKKVRNGKPVKHYETVRQRKDGTRVDVSLTVSPMLDAAGRIVGASGIARDISERKRADHERLFSENRFRQFFETLPEYCYIIAPNGEIVDVNLAACAALGYTKDELVGKPLATLYAPECLPRMGELFEKWKAQGELHNEEMVVMTRQGQRRTVLLNAGSVKDSRGNILHSTSIQFDITERKQTEQALEESKERLAGLVESAMDAIIAIDQEQRILLFNTAAENIFGCAMADAIGSSLDRFVPHRFRAAHILHIRQFSETGATSHAMGTQPPLWGLRANGEEFPIEASISQVEVNGKKVFTVIIRDITKRRRTEAALRESEERFRRVVEHIGDALLVDDVDGHLVFANDRFLNLFGFGREELQKIALGDYIAPEYRAQWRDRHHRRMRGESVPTPFEYEGFRRDGTRMWLEVDVVPIRDQSGTLVGTQSAIRDITERKQAEGALHESEERFRLVANTAPVLIWMSGPDKLCNYFNQPWLEFTGRPLEAELGSGWAEGVHAEDLKFCLETYTQAFDRRESFKMQYRLRRKDGEYRWIFDIGVPRLNPDGSFAGYIGSCVDVTERKLAEDSLASLSGRLIEAQEEERKRIAREIHDDYNQRLAMLAIDLEKLGENIGDASVEARQRLHELFNSVSELGADLHSLSHRLHSCTLESLGLVAGVKAFCEEFAEQQGIQVDFAYENVPHGIPGDAALCLFRIVQEGLRNVKKHSGARSAEVRVEGLGERLHLSVVDRGKGFSPNKPSAERGIGIRSMEDRLRPLGGRLEIHSRPLEGARIDAWLPLTVSGPRAAS
ncbi:MAG TPA: PAS domain S-box protein [Terriglobales bacterium]|nr:PAS domain S-box protein [Terriglobales bacterium]